MECYDLFPPKNMMIRYYDYTRRKAFSKKSVKKELLLGFYIATPLIGPFDSEAFSFQEETKYTQGRRMCTIHPEGSPTMHSRPLRLPLWNYVEHNTQFMLN